MNLPSLPPAVAVARGCLHLEEGMLGSRLLTGSFRFGDGLLGDLGPLELTWTWGLPSRWSPGTWTAERSLHEERWLCEGGALRSERSLRTEKFLCIERFLRARAGTSLRMERPRPLSSPAW